MRVWATSHVIFFLCVILISTNTIALKQFRYKSWVVKLLKGVLVVEINKWCLLRKVTITVASYCPYRAFWKLSAKWINLKTPFSRCSVYCKNQAFWKRWCMFSHVTYILPIDMSLYRYLYLFEILQTGEYPQGCGSWWHPRPCAPSMCIPASRSFHRHFQPLPLSVCGSLMLQKIHHCAHTKEK